MVSYLDQPFQAGDQPLLHCPVPFGPLGVVVADGKPLGPRPAWSPWPPADGPAAKRSVTTDDHRAMVRALDLPEPPKFVDFSTS